MSSNWQQNYAQDLLPVFALPPKLISHGEGSWTWDSEGNKYLDFLAGIAVNSLGHAHPKLLAALTEQAAKAMHVSNLFANQPALELAKKLKELAGTGETGKVFFTNSGTESLEAAFKLARKHKKGGKVVTLINSFHGRSLGSLTLTGKPGMHEAFKPLIPNVEYITSDLESLKAAIDSETAAIILEPIQGEAGVQPVSVEFLKLARQLTKEHNALLILDEVQTGIARCGTWFAFQNPELGDGFQPDAIALAKGIAGGFPMGALIVFDSASQVLARGDHGSTFGGNPLAAAVANAVLETIEAEELLENVKAREAQLRTGIAAIPSELILQVRGCGLLLGVALAEPVGAKIAAAALEHGLILNSPNESTIRLVPPLNLSQTEVDEFLDRFAKAIREVENA